jgi:hypothetical protein
MINPFNSKQFQVIRKKAREYALAKWTGPKDDDTLSELLKLFRREKWRGQLRVDYPGNGGINDVVFTEQPSKMDADEN